MLRIYLARHGQDQDNAGRILNGRRDTPLTENGLKQAKEVADKIIATKLNFNVIYCSPLKRTSQTAQTISRALNMPEPTLLNELIEREFGIMTGKPIDDIELLCAPNIIKTPTITYFLSPEGAETFPQLIERAKQTLNEIQLNHTDGNILLVTHGDFGKMLYAAYYNLAWQDVLRLFHFGNSDLLLLAPDSKPEETHVFKIQTDNLH